MDFVISHRELRRHLTSFLESLSDKLGTIFLSFLLSFLFSVATQVSWYKAILGILLLLVIALGVLKVIKHLIQRYWEDPEPLQTERVEEPVQNQALMHNQAEATAREVVKLLQREMRSEGRTQRRESVPDMINSREPENSQVNTVASQMSMELSQRMSSDPTVSSQSEASDLECPSTMSSDPTVSSQSEASDLECPSTMSSDPTVSSQSEESDLECPTTSVHGCVTLQTDARVEDADWQVPQVVTHSSKVVHMRFEIPSQSKGHFQQDCSLARQISHCMTLARTFDEDFTLQFGSAAVLKYTASGPQKWNLQQNWTPAIVHIHRSWRPWSLLKHGCKTWTIRGINLNGAIFKAASSDQSEPLEVLERHKVEWELDEVVCKEPALIQKSAPWFQNKIYLLASKQIDLEEGVTCTLHSEPRNVKKPYWISVVDGLTPDAQVLIMMGSLSLTPTLVSYLDPSWGSMFSNTAMIQSNIQSFVSNSWRASETIRLLVLGYSSILGALLMVTHLWRTGNFISYPGNGKKPWTKLKDEMVFLSDRLRKKPSSPCALPRGITQLNDSVWEFYSPTGKPEMEIIFFHGLQYLDHFEDAFWKTWTVRDNKQMVWPKEWLSKTFPSARIMSVAYNSCALQTVGQPDHDVVNALGECLVRHIVLDNRYNIGQDCPVFLVGHSLGGIVMKQFVLTAFQIQEKDGHDRAILERFIGNINGIFYYATPHGSSRIGELASKIQSRSPILELLKIIDRESESIKKQFRKQRAPRNAHGFAVLEGAKTHYLASYGEFSDAVLDEECTRQGIETGFTQAFSGTVVEEGSGRENVDRCFTLKTADHFTVCRPQSMNDPVIGQLTGFIANCLVKTQGLIANGHESDLNPKTSLPTTGSQPPHGTTVSEEEETQLKGARPVVDLSTTSASVHVRTAPAIKRLNERLWEISSQPWIEVLCFYGRQPGDFGFDAQMIVQESFRKYFPTARKLIVFYYMERNTPLDMDILGENLCEDVIQFQIGQQCPVLILGDHVGVAAINKLSNVSFTNNDDAGTIHRFLENCKNYMI